VSNQTTMPKEASERTYDANVTVYYTYEIKAGSWLEAKAKLDDFLGWDEVPGDTLNVDGIDDIDRWSEWDVDATTPEDLAEMMRQHDEGLRMGRSLTAP